MWLGAVYDFSGDFAKLLHPGGIPPLLEVTWRLRASCLALHATAIHAAI